MFTDETIEVKCSECNEQFVGRAAIGEHIRTAHPDYGSKADYFADIWTENAHHEAEEFADSYAEERRLDKAIDADIDFSKHKI